MFEQQQQPETISLPFNLDREIVKSKKKKKYILYTKEQAKKKRGKNTTKKNAQFANAKKEEFTKQHKTRGKQ